jgi:hypothetical protein
MAKTIVFLGKSYTLSEFASMVGCSSSTAWKYLHRS